jgi:hypothetical protein
MADVTRPVPGLQPVNPFAAWLALAEPLPPELAVRLIVDVTAALAALPASASTALARKLVGCSTAPCQRLLRFLQDTDGDLLPPATHHLAARLVYLVARCPEGRACLLAPDAAAVPTLASLAFSPPTHAGLPPASGAHTAEAAALVLFELAIHSEAAALRVCRVDVLGQLEGRLRAGFPSSPLYWRAVLALLDFVLVGARSRVATAFLFDHADLPVAVEALARRLFAHPAALPARCEGIGATAAWPQPDRLELARRVSQLRTTAQQLAIARTRTKVS